MKQMAKILSITILSCMVLSSCGKPVDEELPTMSLQTTTEEAIPVEATISETTVQTTPATTQKITETQAESETKTDSAEYKTDYDKEYFSQDLFIGDSITTGFSGYGFIQETNIFAKVGLNPITVLTTPITTADGDIIIDSEIEEKQPKRAYIMLGSNGIQWLENDKMIENLGSLVSIINEKSPDTQIIILSVPPVTKAFETKSEEPNYMKKILTYNTDLADFCETNDLAFIDITTIMIDEDGYFMDDFAEADGMHFKSDAYKVVLSLIESTLG